MSNPLSGAQISHQSIRVQPVWGVLEHYAPFNVMPHHPHWDMWGFDLIRKFPMYGAHPTNKSPYYCDHDHFQFLTDLHSDIIEKY